ncbi:MAG: ShlB/FhaC/HecB family hemolysin secretion/activation protein, partial [Okeania sp. SIO2D1]|nr:ShlB/FhaC/HecB family hemolysin secretion/activation protein [Okeania sp. SIO2D1]
NGTLSFSYANSSSGVIEEPFNDLDKNGFGPDINSGSRAYQLSLRQPWLRTIKNRTFEEFALGLTASWQESKSSLLDIPFPLSPGADENGFTRIFAVSFAQEYTKQNPREVLALRSQFNLGLDAFNSNISEATPGIDEVVPDSRFFSWQGQAQYLRLLDGQDPYKRLLFRLNAQLADRSLVSMEQFALGGLGSVRGYRQDTIVADNGIFASVELQLPILRVFEETGVIQVIPFLDAGIGWNNSGKPNPEDNALAAVGLGLQWQQGNDFTARLDWGLPLISVDSRERTWQENGLHFSVQWNIF